MTPLNESFETHPSGSVLRVSLNARTRLNVVNGELLRQAAARLHALGRHADLRCVIFESRDAHAWIGGADLEELGRLTQESAERFIRSIHEVCAAIRALPVPVVASIRGIVSVPGSRSPPRATSGLPIRPRRSACRRCASACRP